MHPVEERQLPTNIAIRQANPNDLQTLVDHNLAMWELDPGEDRPNQPEIHRAFFAAHGDNGAFIAEDRSDPQNPKPIGTVISYQRHPDAPIVDTSKKRGTIALLYVSDEHRRQRIGKALMEKAIDHLEKAGCDQVGLYASEEGMKLYKKMEFTHGREMRLKFNTTQGALPLERANRPVLSPLQLQGASANITVRKADLKNDADVRILIGHEKGIPVADPTIKHIIRHPVGTYKSHREISVLDSLTTPNERNTPVALVATSSFEAPASLGVVNESSTEISAYKEFCRGQNESEGFIAEQDGSPIGSMLVGEWKYPVPPVFTSKSRKDLFTTGIHAKDPQAAKQLLNTAIEYGKSKNFTQFNVDDHQGHEELLESHGFAEGIKMERELHPTTPRQIFQEKTAGLYRTGNLSVTR